MLKNICHKKNYQQVDDESRAAEIKFSQDPIKVCVEPCSNSCLCLQRSQKTLKQTV